MIRIRNIEELEAERERQCEEWVRKGNFKSDFKLKLMRARLCEADLRWADLAGADLAGADLRWADLAGTDLTGADLRWAIFLRSQVGKSVIDNTIITKSQWDKLARIYNQEFMAGFIVKD